MSRSIQFKDVPEGQSFVCNGVHAIKKTSRTGRIVGPAGQGRVFFWGETERVTVEVGVSHV